jgi:hypothetical protein
MGRRTNQLAPYFVQVREFERRLMRDAIAAAGSVALAATTLGVTTHYIRARSRLLGGVFPDEPKNEPPGLALEAWNSTSPYEGVEGSGRRNGKRKRKPPVSESVPPENPENSAQVGDRASHEGAFASSASPELANEPDA